MDFAQYWFMFPVAIMVATTAMLSGIGGTAFFTPIFILIFPLLGPDYVLNSTVTAIAAALITTTFGFTSGFIGYYHKRLIDFGLIKSFLIIAVPAGILGACLAHLINSQYILLFYGLLMFVVSYVLLRKKEEEDAYIQKEGSSNTGDLHTITDRNGKVYQHRFYKAKLLPTSVGGLLTGLVSVGIGETTIPQLVKIGKVSIPVASATSVAIVIVTVFSASFTHVLTLINEGGVGAVPWHLVCYTVPGVLIGGQIGPRLQGRFSQRSMEKAIACVFLVIGLAMLSMVVNQGF